MKTRRKIKKSFKDKFEYFVSLSSSTLFAMTPDYEEIPLGDNTALESFHSYESTGKILPTKEPQLLARALNGKILHKIKVTTIAENFAIERLTFSAEIKEEEAWIAKEIFSLAKKIALKHYGYVPTFVKNSKDFSEIKER